MYKLVLNVSNRSTDRDAICGYLSKCGHDVVVYNMPESIIIVVLAMLNDEQKTHLAALANCMMPLDLKRPLTARQFRPGGSQFDISGHLIGRGERCLIAGPCTIESEQQLDAIAAHVSQAGATMLRGGAFKPRTSPYAFQGMAEEGLQIMRRVADRYGLLAVSELMSIEAVKQFSHYTDIIQIGSRNMQNYPLLKALGRCGKPVLLKRGLCATYQEWLMAAEYIMYHGNPYVILCERGVRSSENYTRNMLDIAAVPAMRSLTHLPIIVDPSHATGRRELVPACALAAMAAGADGVMCEVHTDPDTSVCDAAQTISVATFDSLVQSMTVMALT